MLIEFKVANFRSIREEQTFSLVASNTDKELPSCVIERNLPGLAGVRFLKGAAIYGANASGKSNVLEAIHFVAEFVKNSATELKPGEPTGAQPFKLDRESVSKPSEFEITFVADETRFVFGLAVTPVRVVEEYLVAYPKGAPQRWYHRTYNPERKTYEWAKSSTSLKRAASLQERTRENALFLSVGPQFNHPQLMVAFHWFQENLRFIRLTGMDLYPDFTAELIAESKYHDRIINLLRGADFGIAGANILEEEMDMEEIKRRVSPVVFEVITEEAGGEPITTTKINLAHQSGENETVPLDFKDEESAGTRQYFALIGPWLDTLDHGYTVFIDEIETSLHPLLVKELLKLLLSDTHNPKGAQVVFTTHNPVLLDKTLLRRDQIWFTEKTPAGSTRLYPLTDYQPRKDEAYAKGYLAGRYGGIPYIPEGLKP